MASEIGTRETFLENKLFNESKSLSFIQALRLIHIFLFKKYHSQQIEVPDLFKKVFVKPDLSLSFPGTDIIKIIKPKHENTDYENKNYENNDEKKFLFIVSFLGLYGTSSPLPIFYTEDLFDEQREGQTVVRDFIDIINFPFYELFYKIWYKYNLINQIVNRPHKDTTKVFYSFFEIENKKIQKKFENTKGFLNYFGLFIQRPKSAEGLRILLADVLNEPSVEIIQCVKRKAKIPKIQRSLLGVSTILGENSCIGDEIDDRNGKFIIQIGPVDSYTFNEFLPDKSKFKKIHELVPLYLDSPYDWEIELILKKDDINPISLGEKQWSQLGYDTWVFSKKEKLENKKVVF